ncbi:MAG: hypothetical protein WKF78_05700 [Candidatus Limnocylindrales bacterium]
MYWDSSQWIDERASRQTPTKPRRRFRDVVATGIMSLALVALAIPTTDAHAASRPSGRALVSAWSEGYAIATVQETSDKLTFRGTWYRAGHAEYLGGHVRSTDRRGAWVSTRFTGSAVAWIGPVGPTRGSALVYIDGRRVKTVSTYAAAFQPTRTLFKYEFAEEGTHIITIQNAGTKNHSTVAVDAIVVRGKSRGKATTAPPADPAAAPAGDLPGWDLVFKDDFSVAASEGQFLSRYPSWRAYPAGWNDSSGHGTYDPRIISAHDSVLDIHLRHEDGKFLVTSLGPVLSTGSKYQTYGRYAIRFRADAIVGYKAAWLLWPRSEVWPRDGEIDFPEGDFDRTHQWLRPSPGRDVRQRPGRLRHDRDVDHMAHRRLRVEARIGRVLPGWQEHRQDHGPRAQHGDALADPERDPDHLVGPAHELQRPRDHRLGRCLGLRSVGSTRTARTDREPRHDTVAASPRLPPSLSASGDPRCRDGDDEAAARGGIGRLLAHDLVGEVPGEDQQVVGRGSDQDLGTDDREPRPGHPVALLVRVAVHHVVERLGPDPGPVQEGRALGRGAIGGDRGSLMTGDVRGALAGP